MIGSYSCSESDYNDPWEEAYSVMVINRLSSCTYFTAVAKNAESVDLGTERAKLPSCSLGHVRVFHDETE